MLGKVVTDGMEHIIIMCLSERTVNYHLQLGVNVSTLHCHQQTDFRTGMAATRAISNVSVIVKNQEYVFVLCKHRTLELRSRAK